VKELSQRGQIHKVSSNVFSGDILKRLAVVYFFSLEALSVDIMSANIQDILVCFKKNCFAVHWCYG